MANAVSPAASIPPDQVNPGTSPRFIELSDSPSNLGISASTQMGIVWSPGFGPLQYETLENGQRRPVNNTINGGFLQGRLELDYVLARSNRNSFLLSFGPAVGFVNLDDYYQQDPRGAPNLDGLRAGGFVEIGALWKSGGRCRRETPPKHPDVGIRFGLQDQQALTGAYRNRNIMGGYLALDVQISGMVLGPMGGLNFHVTGRGSGNEYYGEPFFGFSLKSPTVLF